MFFVFAPTGVPGGKKWFVCTDFFFPSPILSVTSGAVQYAAMTGGKLWHPATNTMCYMYPFLVVIITVLPSIE